MTTSDSRTCPVCGKSNKDQRAQILAVLNGITGSGRNKRYTAGCSCLCGATWVETWSADSDETEITEVRRNDDNES